MKKSVKLVLVMFVIHILGTGCSNKNEAVIIETMTDSKVNYNIEFNSLPPEFTHDTAGVRIGQIAYYYSGTVLYSQPIDGGSLTEIPLSLQEGESICEVRESVDGFLVIVHQKKSSGDVNVLRKYDSSWSLVKERELSEYGGRFFELQEDKEGDILWGDSSAIHICDKELKEKLELEAPDEGLGLINLTSKGEFLIYTMDVEKRIRDYPVIVVYDIDKKKKKVRKKYDLGFSKSSILTSGYHANLYFVGPSNELCRYDQEQKTLTRIYGLSDVGIGQVSPYGGVLTGRHDNPIGQQNNKWRWQG